MNKHQLLSENELNAFTPNQHTIRFIDNFCARKGLEKNQIKILDWGCSRGLEVLWLRKNGYNAFGVDIDYEPIQNGLNLAKKIGYNKKILQVINKDGKTDFCEEYFDIIYSNQVFEHIKDIELVSKELFRITKSKGEGYHVFPGFLYPNEGHLHMPFIHWLPKSKIRFFAILLYVMIRREPFWEELNGLNILDRTKVYFKYSVEKTFYRSPNSLTKIFRNNLFIVQHGSNYIQGMNSEISNNFWNKIKQFLRVIFFEDELYLIK